mgnify:CR=1 FL=1
MCIFQLLDLKKGFSLPLWVVASAKAAVKKLLDLPFENYEFIKIPDSNDLKKIKIHSVAFIKENGAALAITFAKSGLDLDLTNNLEIWVVASFVKIKNLENCIKPKIDLVPGYGVGIDSNSEKICISDFAKKIIEVNLSEIIPEGFKLCLEIIFPKGKFLAERTSNKAFGIVEGLSIIGTTAETHISASPEQLKYAIDELNKAIAEHGMDLITFVIGENGLDLAKKYDLPFPIIKVGNWIGPLLVQAATQKVKKIILLGYYGKLIKLAGGIFHTHNHLADARIEILVYLAIKQKIPLKIINTFMNSQTIDDAIKIVEAFNIEVAKKLIYEISNRVEIRSKEYIERYISSDIKVEVILFDRHRKIRAISNSSQKMFSKILT